MSRKGASMIELVVAIVVMGIAVMTLPLLLSQTEKNNEFAMQQEAILAARTKLGDILTYAWDEQNTLGSGVTVVLDVNDTGSDTELNKSTSSRRIGHVLGNQRRKFLEAFNASTLHTALAPDAGEATLSDYDDIDDFNGQTQALIPSTASAFDYKLNNMTITSQVFYVNDNADYSAQTVDFTFLIANANRRSNIKMVQVNVTGTGTNFLLRSYSSNIGESELLRRAF